jgi:hypothetical protein
MRPAVPCCGAPAGLRPSSPGWNWRSRARWRWGRGVISSPSTSTELESAAPRTSRPVDMSRFVTVRRIVSFGVSESAFRSLSPVLDLLNVTMPAVMGRASRMRRPGPVPREVASGHRRSLRREAPPLSTAALNFDCRGSGQRVSGAGATTGCSISTSRATSTASTEDFPLCRARDIV